MTKDCRCIPALILNRQCPDSASCRESATGRRSTLPSAPCAGRTHFRPAIWASCGPGVRAQAGFCTTPPRRGGPGALTQPCIFGKVWRAKEKIMSATAFYSILNTPIGELLLTSDGEALTGVHMEPHEQTNGRYD